MAWHGLVRPSTAWGTSFAGLSPLASLERTGGRPPLPRFTQVAPASAGLSLTECQCCQCKIRGRRGILQVQINASVQAVQAEITGARTMSRGQVVRRCRQDPTIVKMILQAGYDK